MHVWHARRLPFSEDLKMSKGRGSQKCPTSNSETPAVRKALLNAMPGFFADFTDKCLVDSNSVMMFTADAGQCHPIVEVDYMASLRYQAIGSKHVLLAPYTELVAGMKGMTGIVMPPAMSPVRGAGFLRELNQANMKKLARACPLYTGLVAQGEVLYTPAGFCSVELSGEKGSSGFSLRGLCKADKSLVSFSEEWLKPLVNSGKASETIAKLQELIEKGALPDVPC